jgi:hypothetical protein
LFHEFCFVPWILPCYRPEKERFSSQELSFTIISALREFSRRNALAWLLSRPFAPWPQGITFLIGFQAKSFRFATISGYLQRFEGRQSSVCGGIPAIWEFF